MSDKVPEESDKSNISDLVRKKVPLSGMQVTFHAIGEITRSSGTHFGVTNMDRTTQIMRLASLSRIGISEEEKLSLGNQLEEILSYVDKLSNLDTPNIKPTNQVTNLTDVWRKDEGWKTKWDRELLLANVPKTKDGYIKVPKVLEGK